ncbi:hypothetical protein Tco_0324805 [Tanacetum coccineum]
MQSKLQQDEIRSKTNDQIDAKPNLIAKSEQSNTNTEMNESRSGRCRAYSHTNTEMNENRSGRQTADSTDRFRQTADSYRPEQIPRQMQTD